MKTICDACHEKKCRDETCPGNAKVSNSAVMPGYNDYIPSQLYWHEALDRASLACDFFNENVESHPAVQHDTELKAMAENITLMMTEFYQKVGRKSHEFSGSTRPSL
jgi:hypothetical protein